MTDEDTQTKPEQDVQQEQEGQEKKEKKEKKNEEQAALESSEKVPDFAHVVLVPIANPATAADLLNLAASLVHPQEGRVIALVVSLGDVETDSTIVDELKEIVEKLKDECETSLELVSAPSIARGILDASREYGADLIVIGTEKRSRGEVRLGKIVENVMATAACDVLIYRQGKHHDFNRVVVPVEASFHSQVSARMGIRLAAHYGVPVEAMYVQGSQKAHFEGLARIEETITSLPGHRQVKRTVVTAQNSTAGILSRTNEHDLTIIGFSTRAEFEKLVFGDMAEGILNRSTGSVIMVSRAVASDSSTARLIRRLSNWIRPTLTQVEQDDIMRQAQANASLSLDYTILIIISAVLASLGLLQNSAAVIIGAMLVAPLMSPLISFSSGLAIGRVRMAVRALGTILAGVAVAILMSIILGLILPTDTPTAEMISRGRPTLLDAAVALASGVVGAYATARKDIPAALAGVAIAAALMPPICTIGLGLAFQDNDLAYGATILFLTNIICIILAGMVVFVYLGMNLQRYDDVSQRIQNAALVVFFLVSLPICGQLVNLTRDAGIEASLSNEIEQVLERAELVDVEYRDNATPKRVIATVRSPAQITYETALQLEERLTDVVGEEVRVDLVFLPVVRFNVNLEDLDEEVEENADAEATPEIEGDFVIEPEVTPEATSEATPEMTPEP